MTPFNKNAGAAEELSPDLKIAQGAIALMTELADVLKEETVILEQQKLIEHPELLKRKQRLALDYRTMMKSLSVQPEMLKALPEKIRAQIRQTAQKLADMSDLNARTLRTSVVASQQLLQSIIRIVKAEALPQSGYANPKTQHLELGVFSPTCKPVAVNRTA